MTKIKGFWPGWDERAIAAVVLEASDQEGDPQAWDEGHVSDFLGLHQIAIVEERDDLWTYTLHIYQGRCHIGDLKEAY